MRKSTNVEIPLAVIVIESLTHHKLMKKSQNTSLKDQTSITTYLSPVSSF